MLKQIPTIENPKNYTVLERRDSGFVELKDKEPFFVQMQYPRLGMRYAESRCLIREELYERLLAAQNSLPDGIRLCIWDAWRPFLLQKELYEKYRRQIVCQFHLEKKSECEVENVVKRFVSLPVENPLLPPVHTTGGAVDLTLADENGTPLSMGTEFDAFSDKTRTDYFEHSQKDPDVRDRRRVLYSVMTGQGFTNLPSEWWHYDYGDRFWGYYKNQPAYFAGVFEQP